MPDELVTYDRRHAGERAQGHHASSRPPSRPACSSRTTATTRRSRSPAVCRMCLVEVEKAPKLVPACVDHAWPRARWCTSTARSRQEGPRGRARDAAHQPSARLPDLRPGRRVRAAGLRVPGRPGRDPLRARRQALQPGRGFRRRRPVRAEPLHPVHPLRAVHGGRRRRRRCSTSASAATAPTSASVEEQELDHPWAGNVVDLCPVGALLSKDFLHKARAWDLDKTASVCPGCTQGCNIIIDTRDDVVVRMRPRPNLDVNRHFICDYGRLDYRWMNRGDRIEAPLVRDGGRHVATDWDTALARLEQMRPRRERLGGDPGVRPRVHRVAGPGSPAGGAVRRDRGGPGAAGRGGAAARHPEPGAPPRAGAERRRRGAARLLLRLGRARSAGSAPRPWCSCSTPS